MSSFCPGPKKFLIGILRLDVKKYTRESAVRAILVVRTKKEENTYVKKNIVRHDMTW